MLHPWCCSRPGWTEPWVPWASGGCLCSWQGLGLDGLQVLSNPNHSVILGFQPNPFSDVKVPSNPFSDLKVPSTPFSDAKVPSPPFSVLKFPSPPFSDLKVPSPPFSDVNVPSPHSLMLTSPLPPSQPTTTPHPFHSMLERVPAEPSYRAPLEKLFYLPHVCSLACLARVRPLRRDQYRGRNPLLVPLLYDFRRMTARRRLNRKVGFHVLYKTPCGLCLRSMAEIERYLFETDCDFLFLEMFCLDPYVLVDRKFQPYKPYYYIADITKGREDVPLSCVNEIDGTPPPLFKTQNKGWGIRCLDDIAKGSFVCIYAGRTSPMG
uniref:Uncharacterized protein n=1 Tax=Melopsittacus undulatus TaxID=13146 RepID=A0A8V5GM17_MELUD